MKRQQLTEESRYILIINSSENLPELPPCGELKKKAGPSRGSCLIGNTSPDFS